MVVIDQRILPHEYEELTLRTLDDCCMAISDMVVRGAPLIGATAAYGMYFAARDDSSPDALARAGEKLIATRPTAVNLAWAVNRVLGRVSDLSGQEVVAAVKEDAEAICAEDVENNKRIGEAGEKIVEQIMREKGKTSVNILTHCNAGWLACVGWGTATSTMYHTHAAGIDTHVWVDETRPRNQGASLTSWELGRAGVPHTVVADNAGGHLMQHGQVDLCIVGSDRTTANGDVCNKIGTYLKALAAHDNNVPFYVAVPSPSIDPNLSDGVAEIEIEERDMEEVSHMRGRDQDGKVHVVNILADGARCANPGFDVTPAKYVTGLLTERGLIEASRPAIEQAFPELFG